MAVKINGIIKIVFPTKKEAVSFKKAVVNEVSKKGRFSSNMSIKDNFINIEIKDKDITAFKAVVNTYLKYVETIENL